MEASVGAAFLVERRAEGSSSEKMPSSSEYVYFSFLPRVRPSYMENPGSGRTKAAFRARRYSRRLRFWEFISEIRYTLEVDNHLLRRLKSRNRGANSLAKLLGVCAFFTLKFLHDGLQLGNTPRDAPPSVVLEGRVTFAVETEICIIVPFDKPITTFQAIPPPGLDRQWLIQIIIVTRLFVGFLNLRLDRFGRRK